MSNKRPRLEIITNDDNIDFSSVEEGIEYRDNIRRKKWRAYREYQYYIQHEKDIEEWLFKNCDHIWKRSEIDYGPYDKPPFVCQKCHTEK